MLIVRSAAKKAEFSCFADSRVVEQPNRYRLIFVEENDKKPKITEIQPKCTVVGIFLIFF